MNALHVKAASLKLICTLETLLDVVNSLLPANTLPVSTQVPKRPGLLIPSICPQRDPMTTYRP